MPKVCCRHVSFIIVNLTLITIIVAVAKIKWYLMLTHKQLDYKNHRIIRVKNH